MITYTTSRFWEVFCLTNVHLNTTDAIAIEAVFHSVFRVGSAQSFSLFFLCKKSMKVSDRKQFPMVDPLACTSMKTIAKCDMVLQIAEFSESSNCWMHIVPHWYHGEAHSAEGHLECSLEMIAAWQCCVFQRWCIFLRGNGWEPPRIPTPLCCWMLFVSNNFMWAVFHWLLAWSLLGTKGSKSFYVKLNLTT